jgi:uncharacterized Zn-binding protein involved in type VI secretion
VSLVRETPLGRDVRRLSNTNNPSHGPTSATLASTALFGVDDSEIAVTSVAPTAYAVEKDDARAADVNSTVNASTGVNGVPIAVNGAAIVTAGKRRTTASTRDAFAIEPTRMVVRVAGSVVQMMRARLKILFTTVWYTNGTPLTLET